MASEVEALRASLAEAIAERDRLERELELVPRQDPDRLLRLVADQLPVLVAYVDTEHRYRFANRRYEEWFGLAAGATLGRHVREVAGDAVYRKRLPVIERVLAGETVVCDDDVVHGDGSTRTMRMVYAPHVNEGVVLGACFLGQDVTDERRNEAQLRRLAAVVASCQAAIVAVGLDGRVLDWNEGARRLFGWEPGDVLGRAVETLVPPERRDEWRGVTERVRRGQTVDPLDTTWRARDGRGVEISLAVSPFRGENGAIAGASVVALDIAARKAAERELEEFNVRLEHLVARRSAEAVWRSEQLRELATRLTVAEQNERRRVAGLLHDDLQQLILGARMRLDRMRGRSVADPAELDRVRDLLVRSLERTRDLTIELRPPVLFQRGLPAAVEWLGRRFGDDHGLTVEIAAEDWPSSSRHLVDPLLFDAVRELLTNVAKHAGVTRARVELARGPRVLRVVVADEGPGFPPERRTGSGGFGLFNVGERISLLGGRVEVDSGPGAGTRVTLTVPAARAEHAPARPVVASAEIRERATPRAGAADDRIRVVVADDHEVVRDGLAGLLDGLAEFRVVGLADCGRTAVELAVRLRPDVVVMDVNMPGLDGIEATRRIRDSVERDVRVVALSMDGGAELEAAVLEAGASSFVSKAAPSERLIEAILAAVARGAERP